MKTFLFKALLVFNLLFLIDRSSAQNIGINGSGANAHPSALLDVDAVSTPSLGILIPRIALQAINLAAPISSPATSLLLKPSSFCLITKSGMNCFCCSI